MSDASLWDMVEALSSLARTGWMLRGVPSTLAESVAEHSFASAIIAFELSVRLKRRDIDVDPYRAAIIALIHDVGESVIGDIAKTAGISDAKRKAELRALDTLPVTHDLKELFIEFEKGDSIESFIARISESLATILKAGSYISRGYDRVKEIEDNLKQNVSGLIRSRKELAEDLGNIILELFGLSL
jgi:putative hydrolase of HD superfamily